MRPSPDSAALHPGYDEFLRRGATTGSSMVSYRRNWIAGGTYFFTATLRDRRSTLLADGADLLRETMRDVAARWPFRTEAAVVLPDHLHTVWTLPPGDADYAGRWRAIKAAFTRRMLTAGATVECNARGEYTLWQRRYWEHTIRDERDLRRHIDYIHFNPVKHGLVRRAADWPHSTFHRFVARGDLSAEWGCVDDEDAFAMQEFGEPA